MCGFLEHLGQFKWSGVVMLHKECSAKDPPRSFVGLLEHELEISGIMLLSKVGYESLCAPQISWLHLQLPFADAPSVKPHSSAKYWIVWLESWLATEDALTLMAVVPLFYQRRIFAVGFIIRIATSMNILSDELQHKNTWMGLTTKIKLYMFVYLHQRIIDLEVGFRG